MTDAQKSVINWELGPRWGNMDEGCDDGGLENSRILEVNKRMERNIVGFQKAEKKQAASCGAIQIRTT